MAMEGFRRIKQPFENLKEDIEFAIQDRKQKKEGKLLEQLTDVRGSWESGPVIVTVDPVVFSTLLNPDRIKEPESFKKTFPDLYEAFTGGGLSPLILGQIDIGRSKVRNDGDTERYMQDGKDVISAGVDLHKDVIEALKKLATEIKGKHELLSKIDYFAGISRLGSVARHFGFDTFELPDEAAYNHRSHEFAQDSLKLSGLDDETAAKRARRRPAMLAVISAKKLVELYGN